jgi:hypothetical protein
MVKFWTGPMSNLGEAVQVCIDFRKNPVKTVKHIQCDVVYSWARVSVPVHCPPDPLKWVE